jgi:hypothetical protein
VIFEAVAVPFQSSTELSATQDEVWVAFFVFLFFFPIFFSSWSSHKKHEFVFKSNKIRLVIRGQVPAGSVVGNVLYVPFGLTCHQNNTEYNVFLR